MSSDARSSRSGGAGKPWRAKKALREGPEKDDDLWVSGPELVIHGHFYQPPRENPWTEEVGRERSAAPYHDWNERISAECYRPNAVARVTDEHGNVMSIVDNYQLISYNVGPTLLSWLEREQPDTYRLMVDGDAVGHGAIAQAFGHTILPLATDEDIRLQVRWGLADFRYRFGREAKGMWLPECAVNDAVLRIMVEEGVGFTVLAPGQAAQIRSLEGAHDWVDVHQSWFDTSRPYRWSHPDDADLGIDLIFYNGSLSHAVAFEMSSLNSQALVDRMLAAASGRPGLVTLATDGETFGHHHRYSERLLAYALDVESQNRGLPHTNFNKAVAEMRPSHEVRVHESAWSCAHGVGRWKEDCSCSTGGGPGWNQKWRAPLRHALNQLRAVLGEVYTRRAPALFVDASAALDQYVNVMIGAVTRKEFAAQHIRRTDPSNTTQAFTLLEMHRHGQSMFTSCGWFFNDLSGIETVQVLRYAARVVDLLEELGEPSPLQSFLAVLGEARSNIGGEGTGVDVWRKHVEPARVGPMRVVQHVALAELLENAPPASFGPYDVELKSRTHEQRGSAVLATGIARLTHRLTQREWRFAYGAIGLGGLEVVGSLTELDDTMEIEPLQSLRERFAEGEMISNLVRDLSTIGSVEFDLSVALPDERERLLEKTAAVMEDRLSEAYERLYETHRATIEDLARHGYELPAVLRAPAELALAHRFNDAVLGAESSTDPAAYELALTIARQARAAGFEVDSPTTTHAMQRLMEDVITGAIEKPSVRAVQVAQDVMTLVGELRMPVNIDRMQEAMFEVFRYPGASPLLKPLASALHVRIP